ncbi:MAG: hypothetical protein ACRYF0_21810 [Janthinobacterium lividum]
MNYPTPALRPLPIASLATEQSRQRLAAAIMAITTGIAYAIEPYQQQLLDRYARGRLTLDEVVYSLEAAALFRANIPR